MSDTLSNAGVSDETININCVAFLISTEYKFMLQYLIGLKVKLSPKYNLDFFVWMYMKKHNYNKRGTFKIYCIFIFGSGSFSMGVRGANSMLASKLLFLKD